MDIASKLKTLLVQKRIADHFTSVDKIDNGEGKRRHGGHCLNHSFSARAEFEWCDLCAVLGSVHKASCSTGVHWQTVLQWFNSVIYSAVELCLTQQINAMLYLLKIKCALVLVHQGQKVQYVNLIPAVTNYNKFILSFWGFVSFRFFFLMFSDFLIGPWLSCSSTTGRFVLSRLEGWVLV